MKKTTYIFIGLFIAGLILTVVEICLVRAFRKPYEEIPVGNDEYCTLPLQERFSTIIIDRNIERNILLTGELSTLVIKECDSVTEPSLKTYQKLGDIFVCDLANDTLRLTVDFSRLVDSDSVKKCVRLDFDDRNLATIIVPEGMLRNVNDNRSEIVIEDFKTSCLNTKSNGDITLKSCEIDTLRCSGRKMNELRLKDTQVGSAYITQPSGALDVVTDKVSRIGQIEISGKGDTYRSMLDIERANVGEVLWIPKDSAARIDVRLSRSTELRNVVDK